jgi:hypothetical protein
VPNTFCDLENGDTFRKMLLQSYHLTSIWQTGWAFDNAVVDTLVFQAIHEKCPTDSSVTILRENLTYQRKISDFLANSLAKIDYRNQPGKSNILDKLRNNSVPLGSIALVKAGVKLYEKGKGKPNQTEAIIAERPYTTTGRCPDGFKPLYRGADITRFHLNSPSEFVNYGVWLAAPRNEKLFTSPKILMRRTDDRLMSAIEHESAICVNSCHVIKLKTDCETFDYEFLMPY